MVEKLKPGWRKVKFGDVVRLTKARCAGPLGDMSSRWRTEAARLVSIHTSDSR